MRRETVINAALAIGLLAIPLWAHVTGEIFTITLATRVAILALAAVGLNLALGLGGLVSFGHAAYFGLGGYAMGILAFHAQTYDPIFTWPFVFEGSKQMLVIWAVALVASGLAAALIGMLTLHTSGAYFIMATLAFGQMFYYLFVSWPKYGGEDGMAIYVRNEFPGLNTLDPIQFFLICYALLMLGIFISWRIARSPFGLALQAARQNAERVETVGIRPFRIRLAAFVISGMITGLAGALMADLNRFVGPTMFSWHTSGEIMVLVILGGVARLYGPVAGAALFILLEHWLGGVSDYWLAFVGALLLLVVLFARGGLIGSLAGREVAHD